MTVLVLSPHPDDETIGCGGSLRLHAQAGERIIVVFLTSGELGLKHLPRDEAWRVRENEAARAGNILGWSSSVFLHYPDWQVADHAPRVIDDLVPILETEQPSLLYVPHPGDLHPDHQAVWSIVRQALSARNCPLPEIRGYEIWTPLSSHDYVQDITPVMPRKLRALRAYPSQLTEFDYAQAVRGLNQYRGALAGKCRYAEVFQALLMEGGT